MYYGLQRRLYMIMAAIFAVIVVGTTGYKVLGGPEWSLVDALYMTVITITTVGYGEVHPLINNPGAKLFNVFFILVGMGIIAYGAGNLTAFIIEGDLKNLIWRRRTMKHIKRLKRHIIVCGAGDIGLSAVEELMKTKRSFVLIERDMDKIENLKIKDQILILQGDATDDEVLLEAGISDASGIVSTLSSDKDNLFITVSARQLNPGIRIVVRSGDPATQKKLARSGANAVVSTNEIGAMRLVSEMVRPTVVNFLDQMLRRRDQTIRIEEVAIPEASPYMGKNLFEANIGKETGVLVIALRNPQTDQFVYSITPEMKLNAGDIIVVIGTVEQLQLLREKAGCLAENGLEEESISY
jgi:voltage-gated potassium channel